MYIVFEGIDQCGKGTQIKKLLEKFTEINREHVLFREPGGTPLSEQIREILLHKKELDINPNADMLLFFASRAQLMDAIEENTNADKIVVVDRSFYSTIAYQGYGRGVPLEKIYGLVELSEIKIPDLVVLLDISIDEMVNRKTKMADGKDRFESLNKEFYEKARQGYLDTAKKESERFLVVNGEKSIEEIHKEIWEKVKNLI